ncbi:hypothetical protein ACFCYB_42470 [Streptomyces sp. NPDC056309]|uniref:hypothetical protein n=1 Tax=unclassified Streptomyces TaxID=2593676 RepID=UPI0035E10A22
MIFAVRKGVRGTHVYGLAATGLSIVVHGAVALGLGAVDGGMKLASFAPEVTVALTITALMLAYDEEGGPAEIDSAQEGRSTAVIAPADNSLQDRLRSELDSVNLTSVPVCSRTSPKASSSTMW